MSTNQTKPTVVADDVVVSLDYTLTVENEIMDSSEEGEPLEFLVGHQNVIPGLERQLYGMTIGDSKEVDVAAADAYGTVDPEAVVNIPRDQFPADIPLEVDIQLQVKDMDGDIMDARIVEISADSVRLDFNHPLAGQDLHFSVKVVDLRAATEEELAHGHVHGSDFDDELLDEDYFDGEEGEWEDEEEEEDEDKK